MTADSIIFPDFDLNEFYLEITEDTLESIWQQIENYSSVSRRWQAYLNQVSLNMFLTWLQEEQSIKAKVWPNRSALPSFWEVVDGTAIEFEGIRLLLLPTDTLDLSEIRVPQEWVDIPEWVADYYLAAYVNLDEQYLNIWGYTTHQTLKDLGQYDSYDRTYSIGKTSLFQDLNAFWVSQELALEEVTRADVLPLSPLPSVQAENLIERLGNPELKEPRLAIPFTLWGSLIANSSWRQQLCQRRQGNAQPSLLVNLSRWFDNLLETPWQTPETLNLAFSRQRNTSAQTTNIQRGNLITLGTEQVILLVGLTAEDDGRIGVSLQLLPPSNRRYLPEMIQLTLLSETGDVLQSVQSRAQDNLIRIPRFKCAAGFRFRLQITLNDHCIIQDFIV